MAARPVSVSSRSVSPSILASDFLRSDSTISFSVLLVVSSPIRMRILSSPCQTCCSRRNEPISKHASPNIHFLKVGQKSPESTQEAVIPAIVYYYRYLFRHFAVSRMLMQDVDHRKSTICRHPSQGFLRHREKISK